MLQTVQKKLTTTKSILPSMNWHRDCDLRNVEAFAFFSEAFEEEL